MSLKKRRIIFWIFVAVFLFGATYLALYSSGWRINWQELKLEQTGAVYIKSQPTDVLISVSRRMERAKSGLIFYKGTLFTNLSHKSYSIEVEKDGFFPWSKKLEVKPLLVTQTTHIILLPRTPQGEVVFSFPYKPEKVFFSPSYNNLIAKFNSEGEIILLAVKNNLSKLIYNVSVLDWSLRFGAKREPEVKWSPNEKAVLLDDYLFYLDENNDNPLNIRKEFLKLQSGVLGSKKAAEIKIEEIFWHPFMENAFLIKTLSIGAASQFQNSFYLLNLNKKEAVKLFDLKDSKKIAVKGDKIFWINSFYQMFSFNLISKNINSLSGAGLVRKDGAMDIPTSSAMTITDDPDLFVSDNQNIIAVVLRPEGALYIFDVVKNDFLRPIPIREGEILVLSPIMTSGVKKIIFAPDNKKIAVLEKNNIKIIYVIDFYDDFIKKRGDIDFIGEYPDARDFFWHGDSNHLWIISADELKFVEIDIRDRVNAVDFLGIASSDIAFLKGSDIYRIANQIIEKYKIE